MHDFGFVRVGAASPKIKVADPAFNAREIARLIQEAEEKEIAVLVFPELALTGYTCGDLFLQESFRREAGEQLFRLAEETKDTDVLAVVGVPLAVEQRLYNCAAVLQRGQILGVVPKMYIPNQREFYEKRWFSSGYAISCEKSEIDLNGRKVPFGHLLFHSPAPAYTLAVEICEDLWAVIPPSSYAALKGANIIANLSASNEVVAKSEYRQQLVLQQSARCIAAYVYAAAGVHESTTDTVFGGECLIAENGYLLAASPRFRRESSLISALVDVHLLEGDRLVNKTFADAADREGREISYRTVTVTHRRRYTVDATNFDRPVSSHPFIPADPALRDKRCEEIFHIQVAGLARRLEHTGSRRAVLGLSGGLDSTLALLATVRTFDVLERDRREILAVTMPGFGTTGETYTNAVRLAHTLRVTLQEIDIRPACRQHFADINHDPDLYDVTFENVQTRERTQILMDLANKHNGLVVGTGDLSELALGWVTYSGDHISHYAINCGIPKTLVRYLVQWVADHVAEPPVREVLTRILATPISPELLPPGEAGEISQKTEEIIGPYELHDFFLYYFLRYGMAPAKIAFLAERAFAGRYTSSEIKKWLRVFYRRFFSQQFKRSCLPDGPKVGSVCLSPRADWRMPSDAEVAAWLSDLEE